MKKVLKVLGIVVLVSAVLIFLHSVIAIIMTNYGYGLKAKQAAAITEAQKFGGDTFKVRQINVSMNGHAHEYEIIFESVTSGERTDFVFDSTAESCMYRVARGWHLAQDDMVKFNISPEPSKGCSYYDYESYLAPVIVR